MKAHGLIVATAVFLGVPAMAAEITWTGATSTDWNTPGNWDGNACPAVGDDIVIPKVSNQPSIPAGIWPAQSWTVEDGEGAATNRYGSITIQSGATVACLGDATAVNAPSGGTSARPHGAGVTLYCASASVNGTLSANAMGFGKGAGPGHSNVGVTRASHGASAASGIAASYFSPTNIAAYGSIERPTALGSACSNNSAAGGGGAIHLDATGEIALAGTISANGGNYSAGGSVWLDCATFSGAGMIEAKPGYADSTYRTAGGRIAIYYGSKTFTGKVLAGQNRDTTVPGTLYEPGRYAGSAWTGTEESPVAVSFNGEFFSYVFPAGDTTVRHWSVTVADATWIGLHGGHFAFGDVTLSGTAQLRLDRPYADGPTASDAPAFGAIVLNGTSKLGLPDAAVTPRVAASSLSVASGATLYVGWGDRDYVGTGTAAHPHGRGQTLHVAGDASIAGTLTASGRGFGSIGPFPYLVANGFSSYQNRVTSPPSTAHGGWCASYQPQYSDSGYGLVASPLSLGAGVTYATGGTAYYLPHSGGGAVKLEVGGTLGLDGSILADSATCYSGGSSGGSVWIQANEITGSGTVSASAMFNASGITRGGAGGRIAVESVSGGDALSLVVSGSRASATFYSYPGTVFSSKVSNTAAFGWEGGRPALSATYANESSDPVTFSAAFAEGGDATSVWTANKAATTGRFAGLRTVTSWTAGGTHFAWTERFTAFWTPTGGSESSVGFVNAANYVLSGLQPGAKYRVTVDGESVRDTLNDSSIFVAGQDGKISFAATIKADGATIRVENAAGFMLIVR